VSPNQQQSSSGPRVLVTGGSRGIGAQVAIMLAAHGCHITLCYREKHKQAALVAAAIARNGGSCDLIAGDLSRQDDLERVIERISQHGPYDAAVLNASGGLQAGEDLPYAMAINCYALVTLATAVVPLCTPGANVVYVTSHGAHFYYHQPVMPLYAHVAFSKQSGEQCLRRMGALFTRHQTRLHIVSGDIIEGTSTASLIDRAIPGFLRRRRQQVGWLPSVEEFSRSIVGRALSRPSDDATVLASWCGSVEPYLIGRHMYEAFDAAS